MIGPASTLKGFVLRNRRFLLFWTAVALLLRLFFLLKFRLLTNDSLVYGELAKNWLQHGIYGQTYESGPEPTFIRLPGYPMLLALLWMVTGVEHYTAILIVQIVVDVLTCFVVADLARRIASERAARWAFASTALCAFFANYSAVALTETWAIFCAALALDAAIAALDEPSRRSTWVICGVALGAGILLRPDGGILLGVIGACALVMWWKRRSNDIVKGIALTTVLALAPLIPWTARNWRTFHLIQPLAPFNANMPWEFVPNGFHRWARTWVADYSSVEDVLFRVEGEEVAVDVLPQRAFDSDAQRLRTQQILETYVENGNAFSPEIDAQFAALAEERVRAHPLRYYVGLPLMRAADLWLRPRTEMLPVDPHWWRLSEDDPRQFWASVLLGALNLLYMIAAAIAIMRRRVRYLWLFVAFALVRTAFLAWMPNPEPRYVLECYPALLAIAGAAFGRKNSEDELRERAVR